MDNPAKAFELQEPTEAEIAPKLEQYHVEVYLDNRILTSIDISAINEADATARTARMFKVKPKKIKSQFHIKYGYENN